MLILFELIFGKLTFIFPQNHVEYPYFGCPHDMQSNEKVVVSELWPLAFVLQSLEINKLALAKLQYLYSIIVDANGSCNNCEMS